MREIADLFARKMETRKVRVLWGTANLFGARRYMAGAATNPDPGVFAYAAAQVKGAIDVTHQLGGANYVLWGGREGYETLLNTDLKRELAQYGRFLKMVVEYKHKIGFKGVILIEPKPQEPTKHQYDYDVATVFGFLKANGLENEVKVNIEVGHAVLAHHSFEHEISLAAALGILVRSTPTATTTRAAGTPTSSPTTRPSCRSRSTPFSRRAGSAPAGSISTPGCAGSRSSRSTSSTVTSAASTRWRTRWSRRRR